MLKKFLEKISKVNTINLLYDSKKVKDVYLNTSIFPSGIPKDIEKHKSKFMKRLRLKKVKFKILKLDILENNLEPREKDLLFNEINYRIAKINFLLQVYDLEANKLFPEHKINTRNINYFKYNKLFFGLTKKALNKEIVEDFSEVINYDLCFSKEKLIQLIDFAKTILPKEISFIFGKFPNLSHNSGKLRIPSKQKYGIRFVITLFFHEMTHYLRNYNQIANFSFDYNFSDYMDLEEGIALYNEYFYGNKIIKIGHYIPYYDMCYITLLQDDITEEEKKERIYEILKYKGYSRSKSLAYYYRFYKFARIGSKELFLKDLVYTKGYKNVINLLKKDNTNYEKIMAGNIGLKELKLGTVGTQNNFNEKYYFEKMVEKIKSMI